MGLLDNWIFRHKNELFRILMFEVVTLGGILYFIMFPWFVLKLGTRGQVFFVAIHVPPIMVIGLLVEEYG